MAKKIRKKSNKNKNRNYIFIREETEGSVPLYQLDYFNKIKTVISYVDLKSGSSRKRKELAERKRQEKLSSLQLCCSSYLDKLFKQLERKNNAEYDKVLKIQLDSKFNEVLPRIIHSNDASGIIIEPEEINTNYLRYTSNIPIVVKVNKVSEEI